MKRGLVAAVVAFLTDQISKWYIGTMFLADPTVRIGTRFFNLVNAWNKGVSFSMLDNGGLIGTIGLIVFALAVVAFLTYWLWHEKDAFVSVALGLIIGGALGNVTDRIRFGAVRDFLDFHYGANHWPAFNIADTCICIGAGLILLREFYQRRHNGLEENSK